MPSCDVNTVLRLAEASWRLDTKLGVSVILTMIPAVNDSQNK